MFFSLLLADSVAFDVSFHDLIVEIIVRIRLHPTVNWFLLRFQTGKNTLPVFCHVGYVPFQHDYGFWYAVIKVHAMMLFIAFFILVLRKMDVN